MKQMEINNVILYNTAQWRIFFWNLAKLLTVAKCSSNFFDMTKKKKKIERDAESANAKQSTEIQLQNLRH